MNTSQATTPDDILYNAQKLRAQVGVDFHEKLVESLYTDAAQIAEGREVYTQLMEKEIEVLADRLTKMQKTVEDMRTLGPTVDEELAQAVALISGEEDPNNVVAAK